MITATMLEFPESNDEGKFNGVPIDILLALKGLDLNLGLHANDGPHHGFWIPDTGFQFHFQVLADCLKQLNNEETQEAQAWFSGNNTNSVKTIILPRHCFDLCLHRERIIKKGEITVSLYQRFNKNRSPSYAVTLWQFLKALIPSKKFRLVNPDNEGRISIIGGFGKDDDRLQIKTILAHDFDTDSEAQVLLKSLGFERWPG